ncbi:MAG: hypothetical protein IJ998_08890 [Alistipes sp.]|nr:hypothetical protein [Alistipes sp.]
MSSTKNISDFHNRALQQQNTITRILDSCVAVDLQISETWKEIQEQINTIKCYSNDRHNRANVIKTYQEIADLWPNRYSGAYSIASKMEQLQTQINRLEHSYDIENQELLSLHKRLANMTYELWSEDKEKYEMLISDFISRGNRKCSFDIAQIKTNIQKDIATKEKTLAQTVDKYRWLKKEPYRVSYNELISYTVSQSYYLAQIEELRKERRRRIWGTIGSISWGTIKVIAKIVGFAVIAVGAIISLIFAITSKDDDK